MRIALDGMGGDDAPGPNIDGAIAALQADPDLEILLVGDRPQLEALLEPALKQARHSGERLTVVEADGFVGMEEKPTDALRKKPNCSIAVCWQKMAAREADAVVSAGNTGAVVAAGLRTRLFLKGVKRPGIATALPTARGKCVLMDVGANPAARPEHLYQYAIMGSHYAQAVLGIERPRVGLMNIGSEDGKGNELYREAHRLLQESAIRDRYAGNVEGRGLYQGEVDVLICEGFVGNVVLKVSEGMADFMLRSVGRDVCSKLEAERERAAHAFHEVGRQFEYCEEGGAPLLGIDGVCIICHGSSNAVSIANALRVARTMRDREINARIIADLGEE